MAKIIVDSVDGPMPKIVGDGKTGLLVPAGDIAALARGIEDLSRDILVRGAPRTRKGGLQRSDVRGTRDGPPSIGSA